LREYFNKIKQNAPDEFQPAGLRIKGVAVNMETVNGQCKGGGWKQVGNNHKIWWQRRQWQTDKMIHFREATIILKITIIFNIHIKQKKYNGKKVSSIYKFYL